MLTQTFVFLARNILARNIALRLRALHAAIDRSASRPTCPCTPHMMLLYGDRSALCRNRLPAGEAGMMLLLARVSRIQILATSAAS
jgi:hypothetical protein